MTYRLAIFDFDGTLADSLPFFLAVFNTVADRHGFRHIDPARADALRHLNVRQLMDHVGLPMWKLPSASKTFIEMMRDGADAIAPFAGIAPALRHLAGRGLRLAVVSSNAEANVRTVLGPELAALIERYECGMSVFGKARRIRAVVAASGVLPREAIYVGDQSTDLEAAHKAGIVFGAVHWGYATIAALRAAGCDQDFATPHELQRLA